MRGKGSSPIACKFAVGITPAYAGKRLARVFVHFASRDHPRLCGEKLEPQAQRFLSLGSPPPMRGKVVTAAICAMSVMDHPRLCGEKTLTVPNVPADEGSPPPMRGKDRPRRRSGRPPGITPAYAGKSFVLRSCRPCWRDHPRLCGEKLFR